MEPFIPDPHKVVATPGLLAKINAARRGRARGSEMPVLIIEVALTAPAPSVLLHKESTKLLDSTAAARQSSKESYISLKLKS